MSYPITIEHFARLAGESHATITKAARSEIRRALLSTGEVDLCHRKALKYLSGRRFRVDANGHAIVPPGFLDPAIGDDGRVDVSHPVTRAIFARAAGRLLSEDEIMAVMSAEDAKVSASGEAT